MSTSSTNRPTAIMGTDYLLDLLGALPSYVEVIVHCHFSDGDRPFRCMARDLPNRGRRFTNLDTGTEWFIDATTIDNLAVTRVEFPAMDIEVGR